METAAFEAFILSLSLLWAEGARRLLWLAMMQTSNNGSVSEPARLLFERNQRTPSDRDELLNQKVGVELTVLVSRVSEIEGNFQVKRFMVVDRLGEEDDEWPEAGEEDEEDEE